MKYVAWMNSVYAKPEYQNPQGYFECLLECLEEGLGTGGEERYPEQDGGKEIFTSQDGKYKVYFDDDGYIFLYEVEG